MSAGSRWHGIGPSADFAERRVVRLEGREIVVFRLAAGFAAVDDSCPHAGGPLSGGPVDPSGHVECPWHGWSFDLRSGACRTAPVQPVRTYAVRERDGQLELLVDGS